MTAILAIERVFEKVQERALVEAPDVLVTFDWKKPANQLLQSNVLRANRIAFVPGDDGKAGSWLAARFPGKLSRSLRTMLDPCTVYVWAYDGPDTETANSPLAQWRACRLLLDATIRWLDLALRDLGGLHDSNVYSAAKWVRPKHERSFGAECSFVLTLLATVPDELPDLSGPYRAEVTNTAPSITAEIAPDEVTEDAEVDPPPITTDE